MSVHRDIAAFAAELPPATPIAGLDLGTKTIGVAVSDRLRGIATPVMTLGRVKFSVDAPALLAELDRLEACGVVLGLPLNMNGDEGPRAQSTLAFARNLSALTGRPMTFWDERLSTVAAERAMLEADASRAERARKIDHVAASFILQGALDRLRNLAEAR